MGLELVTFSPSPVTLDEVKAYLRIDGSEENEVLLFLLDAATAWVEEQTRQQLGFSTFEQTLDAFPEGDEIKLPKPPLRSVEGVYYFNEAGQRKFVPSNSYTVDITSRPGRIVLKPGRSWPDTDGSAAAIRIEF